MAAVFQYTCDHCRKVKGEANHWYCLRVEKFEMNIYEWSLGIHYQDALHLCGEACLHAEVSSAIAAGQGQQIFRRRPSVEQVVTESEVRGVAAA